MRRLATFAFLAVSLAGCSEPEKPPVEAYDGCGGDPAPPLCVDLEVLQPTSGDWGLWMTGHSSWETPYGLLHARVLEGDLHAPPGDSWEMSTVIPEGNVSWLLAMARPLDAGVLLVQIEGASESVYLHTGFVVHVEAASPGGPLVARVEFYYPPWTEDTDGWSTSPGHLLSLAQGFRESHVDWWLHYLGDARGEGALRITGTLTNATFLRWDSPRDEAFVIDHPGVVVLQPGEQFWDTPMHYVRGERADLRLRLTIDEQGENSEVCFRFQIEPGDDDGNVRGRLSAAACG